MSGDRQQVTAPPFHLMKCPSAGVWAAVQQLYSTGKESVRRTLYFQEPPGMFRDGLGQYCWCYPNIGGPLGFTFCSDASDHRHYGMMDDLETLRNFGFVRLFGQVIKEKARP